ncbi:late embryogenesis abundant protein At1g64065-like [Rhodamnia argentea]|uniref:Late embryogenesis abundant protein At1g64065-like n=1 Tax=Rhodamnia argentea TaxID=178133 RepID=A0A8B8PDV6_9MYRT|nr:late embryogenesis abundant protein At1g64065-like [Rhodamnia argentea]
MRTNDPRRKGKIVACVIAAVIAQTAIILLFMLLVMRIRNPKVRLNTVSIENLKLNTSTTSPSFSMQLHAQVAVKNTNFGHFKFEKTTAMISYRGVDVGSADIVKAKVRALSTKRMNVTASVSSKKFSSVPQFRSDVNSGILTLNGHAKLSGKVRLFKVFKKKKSAGMNCTMDVDTKAKVIKNLKCK